MKWTNEQVDRMTLAGFHAAIGGYVKAHAASADEDAPTEQEYLRVLMEEKALGRA